MQKHTRFHPENKNKKDFSVRGDQVVGRQKPAHHQEYCSEMFGGCVKCFVSYSFWQMGQIGGPPI